MHDRESPPVSGLVSPGELAIEKVGQTSLILDLNKKGRYPAGSAQMNRILSKTTYFPFFGPLASSFFPFFFIGSFLSPVA